MKLHPWGMVYTILYIILCKIFLETFAKRRSGHVSYTIVLLGVLSVLEYVLSIFLSDFMIPKAVIIILLGTIVMSCIFEYRNGHCGAAN